MDSTPLSHKSEPRPATKSASRISEERENISVDLNTLSPSKTLSPSQPLPLHELLLLSPSPLRRSRTRLIERTDMAEEPLEAAGSRRRCKTRTSQMGALGCASPRNARRTRRRVEQDLREDKDFVMAEDTGKVRKRRHSGRSKKEKLSLVPSVPSSSSSPSMSEFIHLFNFFCYLHFALFDSFFFLWGENTKGKKIFICVFIDSNSLN